MAYPIPSPFVWDVSFDVGSDKINEQHKKLFTLITDLEADQGNAGKLTALVEYVVMHFKTEEEGFSSHHYAHEVEHKAIHQKFLADATAAVAGGVNPGIIAFLKDWLVTHIKGSDMKYKGIL